MLPMHVTLKEGVMYITYPSPESTVVREIISNLQTVGKKVSMVCSSGKHAQCTILEWLIRTMEQGDGDGVSNVHQLTVPPWVA